MNKEQVSGRSIKRLGKSSRALGKLLATRS